MGSGRMRLHASNLSLCLSGQDIEHFAIPLCKINDFLYAPWLSVLLPASILGGAVEPSPASLPAPDPPPEGMHLFRTDDCGQGLLFEP